MAGEGMSREGFYRGYHRRQGAGVRVPGPKDEAVLACLRRYRPRVGNLLDVGCLNSPLSRLMPQAVSVERLYGVDLLPPDEAGAGAQGMLYEQANLDETMPFPGVRFDAVVASEIIEHLFAPDNLFLLAAQRLNPGGILVVTTPNLAAWYNRVSLLLGYQPCHSEVSVRYNVGKLSRRWEGEVGGHLRLFTLRALTALAAQYGLAARFRATVGGGNGVLGFMNRLFARLPGMGPTLVCVFARRGDAAAAGG